MKYFIRAKYKDINGDKHEFSDFMYLKKSELEMEIVKDRIVESHEDYIEDVDVVNISRA